MRILAITPGPLDATSLYRCWGPLSALHKSKKIDLVEDAQVNWKTLRAVDLVFMSRPSLPVHLRIAEMARNNSVPVVVDWDDDLFDVPVSNPAFWTTSADEEFKDTCKKILAISSLVIASTEHLKKNFEGLGVKRVEVVPNAWDEEVLGLGDGGNENPVVMWRGSNTHDADLASISAPLLEVMGDEKEFSLHFLGQPLGSLLLRLVD